MSDCTPNFEGANPCANTDPSLIREMGLPGQKGLPGSTPVFVVGTVIAGPTPSVTFTAVNPLLYRVDFIIPSTNINTINNWTATQNFTDVTVAGTFTTTGGATIDVLEVTGAATFGGAVEFNGAVTYNSSAEFLAGFTANTGTITGDFSVDGTFTNDGISQLPAAMCIRGQVVANDCGQLFYINGQGPNSVVGATALAQSVAFNAAEAGIAFTLAFTVPFVASCGSAMNQNITVFGRVLTNAGGALPADISKFIVQVRLDDLVTGTVIANGTFTNFEAGAQWFVNANVAPGAHTLYFTVQGLGVGTASIGLTEIDCSVNL